MAANEQQELAREEALRLLGTVPLGRVVFTDRALPAIRSALSPCGMKSNRSSSSCGHGVPYSSAILTGESIGTCCMCSTPPAICTSSQFAAML